MQGQLRLSFSTTPLHALVPHCCSLFIELQKHSSCASRAKNSCISCSLIEASSREVVSLEKRLLIHQKMEGPPYIPKACTFSKTITSECTRIITQVLAGWNVLGSNKISKNKKKTLNCEFDIISKRPITIRWLFIIYSITWLQASTWVTPLRPLRTPRHATNGPIVCPYLGRFWITLLPALASHHALHVKSKIS